MFIRFKDNQNNEVTVNAEQISAIVVPSPLSPQAFGTIIFYGGSSGTSIAEAQRVRDIVETDALNGKVH